MRHAPRTTQHSHFAANSPRHESRVSLSSTLTTSACSPCDRSDTLYTVPWRSTSTCTTATRDGDTRAVGTHMMVLAVCSTRPRAGGHALLCSCAAACRPHTHPIHHSRLGSIQWVLHGHCCAYAHVLRWWLGRMLLRCAMALLLRRSMHRGRLQSVLWSTHKIWSTAFAPDDGVLPAAARHHTNLNPQDHTGAAVGMS
jgi:hypothetical protein